MKIEELILEERQRIDKENRGKITVLCRDKLTTETQAIANIMQGLLDMIEKLEQR